jgi:SMC interacting uncharacterized protein involved in chromosome segregation
LDGSNYLQVLIQTGAMGTLLIYLGKVFFDRFLKKSEELEKIKAQIVKKDFIKVEDSISRFTDELKLLKRNLEGVQFEIMKIQHKLEESQIRQSVMLDDSKAFVNYANKVIQDLEKSKVIELGQTLQMIKKTRKE